MDEEQKTRIEDTAALLSPNKVPSDKHKQVDEVELEEQEVCYALATNEQFWI